MIAGGLGRPGRLLASGPGRLRRAAGLLAVVGGLALAGHGAWIPAKAWLAQQLIERAWAQSHATASARAQLAGSAAGLPTMRPWPWADTVPIARLGFDRLDQHLIVLAGDSGAVLAFGPGHRSGSARPGGAGNAVISGHRDTHFALLKHVRDGDTISFDAARAEGQAPARQSYSVVDRRVVRADDPAAVASVIEDAGDDRLTLVTCWPFDAIDPGTPWRYVVTAVRHRDGPSIRRAGGSIPAPIASEGHHDRPGPAVWIRLPEGT